MCVCMCVRKLMCLCVCVCACALCMCTICWLLQNSSGIGCVQRQKSDRLHIGGHKLHVSYLQFLHLLQKPAGIDLSRVGDAMGAAADAVRPDAAKALPSFPPTPGAPLTPDAGKMGHPGRVDGFGGRGNEDRMIQDSGSNRGEDRCVGGDGALGRQVCSGRQVCWGRQLCWGDRCVRETGALRRQVC